MKDRDITRSMIQRKWLSDYYFWEYDSSKVPPKFFPTEVIQKPGKFVDFEFHRFNVYPLEMEPSTVIVDGKWRNPIEFLRKLFFYFSFLSEFSFLSLPRNKIWKIFEFLFFKIGYSYSREGCNEINETTYIGISSILFEILSFKYSTRIFLLHRDSPIISKDLYLFKFSNFMSSDRNGCRSNDSQLNLIRSLLVLEIFDFSCYLNLLEWQKSFSSISWKFISFERGR